MIDRHVAFRKEAGLNPTEYFLMAKDEWIYQMIQTADIAKREMFRRLPCMLLERHRRRSGHKVTSEQT
jgi:hypothetical protein